MSEHFSHMNVRSVPQVLKAALYLRKTRLGYKTRDAIVVEILLRELQPEVRELSALYSSTADSRQADDFAPFGEDEA